MLSFFERKFLPILILLSIGFFALADTEALGSARSINFPNPNLQQVIRDTIGKPTGNIYESDLVWLPCLGVWDRGISDLSGLEYYTNLISVSPWGNSISDISALSGVTSPTKLDLDSNNITDISALSALTNLTGLSLMSSNIGNIQPLVDNAWLGTGDDVEISYNYLDLAPGFDDMQNIQSLINRGVDVGYELQNETPDDKHPTANAGPDQTLTDTDGNGSEKVTLNGSGSTHPDGDPLSYYWTESGLLAAMLIATGVNPTVTLSVGTHAIILIVIDDEGAYDTDEVLIIVAPSAHTVGAPTTPSGPSSGQVGDSLDFSTGGSICSQGHSVQYRFDWGSGGYSNWSSSTSASHSYSSTGTYQVRAQARCASDTSLVSSWSGAKTVTISAGGSDETAFSCGPNPVPDTGTAFFYSLPVGTSTAKLMVFGATSGRLLFETSIDVTQTRFPATGTWDPVDNDGVKLANGPYLYVLIANGQLIGQGKMVIQR